MSPPTETRLEMARRLFEQYYARCFWHCRRDLVRTEADIPTVVKGLRQNGGKSGMLAAAALDAYQESATPCP